MEGDVQAFASGSHSEFISIEVILTYANADSQRQSITLLSRSGIEGINPTKVGVRSKLK
jgi:hypothetical protein